MTNELSNAAAALGRIGGQSTSTAKQQAARENGKRGGRPTRYELIARLAGDGCTAEIVKDFVEYDEWDNQAEHDEWIESASNEEIADWIAALRK